MKTQTMILLAAAGFFAWRWHTEKQLRGWTVQNRTGTASAPAAADWSWLNKGLSL